MSTVPLKGRGPSSLLLGRDREVQEVSSRLLEPGLRGAVIVGAGGMGKSALADHVLERLDGIVSASYIHGSPVLSRMPYGVLSPYLESAGPQDMDSPLAVLRTIRRHFRRIGEVGSLQPLLVVDDAHHLDESSCHVLTQLAMSGELRLLVLTRPRARSIHELLSLARDGLLARIDLGALSAEAVDEVCQGVLGGPVLRATSALLTVASGGNPLYLRALLAQSRRLGTLAEGNGAWYLRAEPDGLDASVVDLVKGQLASRTPEERAALETLALAKLLPRSVLVSVCGPAPVHALMADGLLHSGPGMGDLLCLSQPLHAEVIRSLVPTVRSAAIRSRVLAELDGSFAGSSAATGIGTRNTDGFAPSFPFEEEAWLRRIEWGLDCGDIVPDELLLKAARKANDSSRSAQARRFGSAVRGAGHLIQAKVETAVATAQTGDLAQARLLLEGILGFGQPTPAPDGETLNRAALALTRIYQLSGLPGHELEELAGAWSAASGKLSSPSAGMSETGSTFAGYAELLRSVALMVGGDYAAALARLNASLASGNPEFRGSVAIHGLLAELLVSNGQISSALEHTDQALQLIKRLGGQLQTQCGAVLVRHAQALLHGGRFAELESLLEAKLGAPPQYLIAYGGTMGVFEGAVEIHQGRLREGLQRLHPAVEALRVSDPEMMLPYALGLAGYASTVVGDHAQTARYAKELRSVGYTGPRPLWLVGQAYAAAALASSDSDAGAPEKLPEQLAEVAEQARAEGFLAAEKDILELCLAVGDLRHASRLVEVSAVFEGGEAQALHAYAEAVASGSPDRMVAAADEAVRHRKYLIAVESIGHAIRFYGTHGNLRRQRALIQQLRRRRGELAGVTVSYLSPSLHLVRLTRREHEIIGLLLAGASTKDVAAHFTLSQRTVEGHVYRIYVKLGISRRADLEAAYLALEPGVSPAVMD